MSNHKNDGWGELSRWAERLEAGAADEPTLKLAAWLQKQRPPAPEPPAEFTAELRRQLLDEYERRPVFDLQGLGRLVGSAVALGLLALAVVAAWLAMAQRPGAATDPHNTVTITRRGAEVVYDRLQVGLTTAEGEFVEGTAEFWQSGDGRLFRGQIVDDAGDIQVVVVIDGTHVTYGTRAEPAGGSWFLKPGGELFFTTIENAEAFPGEKAPHAIVSTLYTALGWEGVVQVMIQPDLVCADHGCVINQVSHPAPTNPEDVARQGCDGYGSSIAGTETWPDGRSIDVIKISYGCYSVTYEADSPADESEIPPSSEYVLPQYRLVKVDSESFELLEVIDYDGDTILRRIRRLERQRLSAADLPAGLFNTVPDGLAGSVNVADETAAANPDATAITGTVTTGVGTTHEQLSIRLGDALGLTGYELNETEQGLEVTLYWHARQQPADDYTVSIGLMDENGNLISAVNDQIGSGSHPTSTWTADENVHETYNLPIPANAPEGRYELSVQVLDPQSGTRLPVRTNNERVIVFDNFIWLTDWLVESKITETATAANTGNRVWISSITQHARSSKDAPITFEVIVGYEVVSAPEAVIKLHYAAPDWETRQVNGRVPMDGMSEFVPITADENSVTLEFTGSAQEMAQIVGTQNPVPVIQLGNFVEHDDGRGRELQLYALETFAGYPFSLATTEEIRYTGEAETRQTPTPEPGGDHLAYVSVWPPTSTVITGTTPTTFMIQLRYQLETVPEAEILVFMMPAGGGASLVVASEEVTAGEGEITLSFPFNPRLDLYAGEASEWRIFAAMGTFGESGGDSLAGASPHDSLEDVWRYEP